MTNNPMKRFLLFAGDNYYPSGGWDDFVRSYDTLEEALAVEPEACPHVRGDQKWLDWGQIVDTHTAKTVAQGHMESFDPKTNEGAGNLYTTPMRWVWKEPSP